MNNRLKISIGIYLILTTILLIVDPKWTHNNGDLKEFGTGEQKTIFPLWIILFVMAVLSFYFSQVILLLSKRLD